MIMTDRAKNDETYEHAWIMFIFSPVILPIMIGMIIEEQSHKN